jgi:hypothetical protein
MNVAGNLKRKVGRYVLDKQLRVKVRRMKSCNLREAKTIGLLFDATQPFSFEIIKDLVKDLSSTAKEVKVLGYVDSKQMIDHYLYRKGFEFFTRTHLNWFSKPQSDAVNDFIKKDFDILLNLSLEQSYPVNYIFALSNARFKAGRYFDDNMQADFMINIEKEKAAILELQKELTKDQKKIKDHSTSYDNIAEIKTNAELQLNFLINQLVHYLSQIKN